MILQLRASATGRDLAKMLRNKGYNTKTLGNQILIQVDKIKFEDDGEIIIEGKEADYILFYDDIVMIYAESIDRL